MASTKQRPFKIAFEEKYVPEPMSGCWIWIGSTNAYGYGDIRYKQKPYKAHRASWMIHKGDIPNGMIVCHKCDVPACVNPNHLFLGTHMDNTKDKIAKGRMRVGNHNRLKTHCIRGHVLLPTKNPKKRRCVECWGIYRQRRKIT